MVEIGRVLTGLLWRDALGRVGVDFPGPALYYVGMVELGED